MDHDLRWIREQLEGFGERKGGFRYPAEFRRRALRYMEFLGRPWKGNEFEQAIRVFDYPSDDMPVGFVMEEGVSDPKVLIAFDHTDWRGAAPATAEEAVDFETYLELVLATYGTKEARRDWFLRPAAERKVEPVELAEILPESMELKTGDDGATFEIVVESVTEASAREARIALLTDLIPGHRVKNVAKVLDLKPFNRKADVLIPEIVDATEDPGAIKAATANKLLSAANCYGKKNKGVFLEKYGVGMTGGESIVMKVTTTFDRSGQTADRLNYNFTIEEHVKAYLVDLGVDAEVLDEGWVGFELLSEEGRAARVATIQVNLSRPTGLMAGQTARSKKAPAFFREVDGKIYQVI